MRMTIFGPTKAPPISLCFPDLKTQKRRYRRLKLLKLTKNKGFPPSINFLKSQQKQTNRHRWTLFF